MIAADLLRGALDLVFAPVCVGCRGAIPSDASDRGICVRCWSRARAIPAPRCDRCWTPLPVTGSHAPVCRECPELRPAIRAIRSAFLLDDCTRPLVHSLKYRGWHSVAAAMAERMATLPWSEEVEEEVSIVVPVPLAPARARQRGYNQAAVLSRELARIRGWRSLDSVLLRSRSSGSQTALHPGERRANVAGAFRVEPGSREAIATRHLLLVDDVWTTGATALSCADALLGAGARAVSVLTFARALPEFERLDRRIEQLRTFNT